MIVTLPPLKEDRSPFPQLRNMKQSLSNDEEQSNLLLEKNHGVVLDSNYAGNTRRRGGHGGLAEARVITAQASNDTTSVRAATTEYHEIASNITSPSRRGIVAVQRNIVLSPRKNHEQTLTTNNHSPPSSFFAGASPRQQLYSDNSCTSSPSAEHNSSRTRGKKYSSPSSSRKLRASSVALVQDDDVMGAGGRGRFAAGGIVEEEDNRQRQETRGRKRSASAASIPDERPLRNSFLNSNATPVNHLGGSSSNRSAFMNPSGRGEVNYQDKQGLYVHVTDMHNNGTTVDNRLINNNFVMGGINGTLSSVPRDRNQGRTPGPYLSLLNHQAPQGEMIGDPRHALHQPSFPAPSSISIAPTIFKAHQIMVNSPHPGDVNHLSPGGVNIYNQGGIRPGVTQAPQLGQQPIFLTGNIQHPAGNQLQEGLQFINGNTTFSTQHPQLGIFDANTIKQPQKQVDGYHPDDQVRRVFQDQQHLYQQQQNNPLSNSAMPVQWMNYHSSIPSDPYGAQSALLAAQQQQRQQQVIPASMLVQSQMAPSSVQQPFLMNNSYASGYAHGLMSATSSSMPSSSVEHSTSNAGRASDALQHNGYITKSNRDLESNRRGVIHQGKHVIDHYSNRKIRTLETHGDSIWLSDFLCFLRRECCEVFTAAEKDVQERRKSKQINLNQVGIRCRFCAHLPHNIRVGRSSCFPSSVDRIYQSVTMMIREHFPICDQFPDDVRRKYIYLKKSTKKGEMESKAHWKRAARELGMVDTPTGIYFESDLIEAEKKQKIKKTEMWSTTKVLMGTKGRRSAI
jgi:hypothetical protein